MSVVGCQSCMLYIVATPIGNLEDITLRAISALSSASVIYAEDTRVAKNLCERYNIKGALKRFDHHSDEKKMEEIAKVLRQGDKVALVSDAGTPGINDPGGKLVAYIAENYPEIRIVPIPGPNAAITALSVSGFPAERFVYMGFPPNKKGRQKFFRTIASYDDTVVFYESKYRIKKAITELKSLLGGSDKERLLLVAREITKQFETLYRGTAEEVSIKLEHQEPLGEFVVILAPKKYVRNNSK